MALLPIHVFAMLVLLLAGPVAAQGPAPAPVTVVAPVRQNVPVLVRAIGTVQPNQTVLVRARVDGALDKILFTEGQAVRPGDALAQIDPRAYQVALDQALARRAADEAALINSRGELVRYAELAQSQATSRQRLDLQRANLAQAEAASRGSDAAIAAAQLNLDFVDSPSAAKGIKVIIAAGM